MPLRPRRAGVLLLAPLLIGATACADDHPFDTESLANATFDLADYRITGPAAVPAGGVQVTTLNRGAETHQAVFAKLNDGVTAEDYATAFLADTVTGLTKATYFGGTQTVVAGAQQTVELDLQPGDYAVFCVLPSPSDGVSHLAKGMITELTVTGPARDIGADQILAPAGDEVDLINWAFEGDADLVAGETYRVANQGTQVHELVLAKLNDNATPDGVLDALKNPPPAGQAPSGPPPYTEVSGAGWLTPGNETRLTITEPPGNYVLICFLPDPSDGVPHFAKGMFKAVTLT